MTIRAWKAVFVAIFSAMALIYALQNVANLGGGMYASFAYVLGQADHAAYPESIFPAIHSPLLIWFALLTVLLLEFACAGLTGLGAWRMWRARQASGSDFRTACLPALNGLGVAVLVWMLLFGTFGGALFQMWQNQVGSGSANGAFQLTVYALLLFGLLSMPEPS
ncbi:DUF2165 family protein [Ferrimonas marina]|uniref:Predicted small integral membrane protein n=1 Tax=Ferrimonas marina TaxID=299255 RepID=A0A1M5P5R8_9GAMM|nr:DUF2165 family protein [Ferrimonas marina]SHG97136.1 Predicted small integral membrane protein [Ferrimonas marina]